MLSPSDFNNAVPQFTNGDYASNPINPQYIAEPDAVNYNRGAEPLQTLPAQWWNWFLNRFTTRFNKINIYVKNIFNELTQLLSLVSVTPSGTEGSPTVGQLKDMFENKYPSYLALLMYPVGSIYWTGKAPDDGGDPNELFGGTWVQIKGKFVWAKGDGDTLNATGGEKTHTLTTSEIPSHNHSFTPAGSVSVTTNPAFTGSQHSHSYTPAGSVSVTTNPTFTGSQHSHSYTPAGSVSVTTNPTFTGSAVTSGGMSAHSAIDFTTLNLAGTHRDPMISFNNGSLSALNYNAQPSRNKTYFKYESSLAKSDSLMDGTVGNISVYNNGTYYGYYYGTLTLAHTHSVTASGSISGGAYKFTGTQATLKATAGGSISGGAYKFTGTAATLTATAGGSISGGAYKFTGSAGTTGSKGDGNAHNNMPPYVVKYCWERTA